MVGTCLNSRDVTRSPFPRRSSLVAVVLSFGVLVAAAWIRGGVAATPYETADSAGRTMGFNDVFSGEHYRILLRNADWGHSVEQMGVDGGFPAWQNWGLAAAHGVLIALLLAAPAGLIRAFLLVQPVVFFWGWIGFWFLPVEVADILFLHTSDREGFVDTPYIQVVAQGAWFWACALTFWNLRSRRTGAANPSPAAAAPGPSSGAVPRAERRLPGGRDHRDRYRCGTGASRTVAP